MGQSRDHCHSSSELQPNMLSSNVRKHPSTYVFSFMRNVHVSLTSWEARLWQICSLPPTLHPGRPLKNYCLYLNNNERCLKDLRLAVFPWTPEVVQADIARLQHYLGIRINKIDDRLTKANDRKGDVMDSWVQEWLCNSLEP